MKFELMNEVDQMDAICHVDEIHCIDDGKFHP
jgi:hypothetical protein